MEAETAHRPTFSRVSKVTIETTHASLINQVVLPIIPKEVTFKPPPPATTTTTKATEPQNYEQRSSSSSRSTNSITCIIDTTITRHPPLPLILWPIQITHRHIQIGRSKVRQIEPIGKICPSPLRKSLTTSVLLLCITYLMYGDT